jgi:hypothetical protein
VATILYAPMRGRRHAESDELQQLAERLEQFERHFVSQLRDDLVAAEARLVLARTDEVAARLTRVLVAAQRLNEAVENPRAGGASSALEVIRTLHEELVRSLTYAALGTVVLLVITFIFVVSR